VLAKFQVKLFYLRVENIIPFIQLLSICQFWDNIYINLSTMILFHIKVTA